MKIAYKHIDRRTFLRGSTVAIGLPFLDAMIPHSAFSQADLPKALTIHYVPNGMDSPNLNINDQQVFGDNYRYISRVTNLQHSGGIANGDGPGDHARAAGTYLTGDRISKSSANNRITFDELVAQQQYAMDQALQPSFEFAMENLGGGDSGYQGILKNLTWRSETSPKSPITDPRTAFTRFFNAGNANLNFQTQSVLDLYAKNEYTKLALTLGDADKVKITEHLESIRQIEQRIQQQQDAAAELRRETCTNPEVDLMTDNYKERLETFFDLIIVAVECDITRMITLSYGNEGSGLNLSAWAQNGNGWHNKSHHGGNAENNGYNAISRFMYQNFATFLGKITARSTKDLVLGRTVMSFGSGIRDGDRHDDHPVPTILAGSLGSGAPINLPARTELANYWLGIAQHMGLNITSLGRYGTMPVNLG